MLWSRREEGVRDVGVAIETPSGPVVESLLEHGVAVHSINPTQRDRFRDRFSPAGAKDDRRDARVLASALRTDAHCLRRLERTDPAIVELREWSRLSEELTRERVRLANQMRQQLWRYYPQFLAAVDDDVAAPWALDLWRSLPTPRAGQRVRGLTLTRVLKQHRIRRIDAATLRDRLRAPAVTLTPGTVEAATTHVRLLVERLALLNRQLDQADRQLNRLVHQLVEAAPAADPDAPTEDEPASSTAPPDAAILLSLPGVGTRVLATLFAEGSDAVRRRDHDALRCLCGVAPVTRRSGKSLLVTQRRAAHGRLRDAVFYWSRVAVQRDPVSHGTYQALRARGHGHARALRSVADRMLGGVRQMRAAVLHLGDLRVRIVRVGPVVVRALLLAGPVEPGQLGARRRREAGRLGQPGQKRRRSRPYPAAQSSLSPVSRRTMLRALASATGPTREAGRLGQPGHRANSARVTACSRSTGARAPAGPRAGRIQKCPAQPAARHAIARSESPSK